MSDYRHTLNRKELFSLNTPVPDREIYRKIKRNWDGISKPIDGLGDFEEVICRLGAIQGKEIPTLTDRRAVIMCADNGIVESGVTQVGKEVTLQVARMLGQGTSTANTLAKKVKAKVIAVDLGIDSDEVLPGVLALKVRRGTRNFLEEEAMTEEEVLKAVGIGIDLACMLKAKGVDIVIAGEMGIGNTTTASTLLSLLLDTDGSSFVGRGAGLDDEGLERKLSAVKKAVEKYGKGRAYPQDKDKAFEYLWQVGGLDEAGLCGLFIGCGLYGLPIVIDGVITALSAILSMIFVPGTEKFMIPSHNGREKGLEKVLNLIGMKPLIGGNMALGEGTGALMLLPLLDVALDFYKSASTFDEGGIKEYKRFS